MEWDLEMPPWDLPELEANAPAANLSSVAASSGSSSGQKPGGMDCSVDLKLGGLGDFGLADKWKEHSRASALLPAAASLAKRPRMPGGGSQNVSCLVDGCRSDLSNCREYHRRHKVCEVHSKTPIVLVGGQEQRFCQQCSRFHLLAEFDEVKRSCRKRLDGHNRRRRKPQIETINPGNLYPNTHGTGFTSYPQTFPSSTDTTWISMGAGAEDTRYGQNPLSMHFLDRVQPFSGAMGIKEGKQFPFVHSSEGMAIGCRTTVEQTAVCQPLLKAFSPAESSGSKTFFSEGLPPVFSSDCALSLLSSSTRTAGINLGSMVTVERIPIRQPLLPSLQYGAQLGRFTRMQAALGNIGVSTVEMENPPVGSVVVSDGSDAELHYHGIYTEGSAAPSDGSSQPPTFTWQYSRHL